MYEYRAKAIKIVDGDTVDFEINLGFDVKLKERFRLYGINAPETRLGKKTTPEDKKRGLAAKRFVANQIEASNYIMIKTHQDKKGKFGRYLAEVLLSKDNNKWINLNDLLVEMGHAVEYMKD